MQANLPPGLTGTAQETSSGGTADWKSITETRLFTNAFVFSDDGAKVLLGYKKRGFGKDLWNGFGGKVDPTETPLEAAKRELQEESGIEAPLEHAGTLLFTTGPTPYAFHIDIFRADKYTGTPVETDEMRPAWFSASPDAPTYSGDQRGPQDEKPLSAIPYHRMWADDEFWFPLMLSRQPFIGRADFDADNVRMTRFWFGKILANPEGEKGSCAKIGSS